MSWSTRRRSPPTRWASTAGRRKQLRPVTITTYQLLTSRPSRAGGFPHLDLFDRREWGLVIYDEVHLLPAPVFRATARIQARRRLGLTATLVREDGAEPLVVHARRTQVLRHRPGASSRTPAGSRGAECAEVRVPFAGARHGWSTRSPNHASASGSRASTPPRPARRDGAGRATAGAGARPRPTSTSCERSPTSSARRSSPARLHSTSAAELYDRFRAGELPVLCVSKVANFALDLPSAGVAIEVSGTFGSRQEEAQRLGRLLRPKAGDNRAWFYTLVSHDSFEQVRPHAASAFSPSRATGTPCSARRTSSPSSRPSRSAMPQVPSQLEPALAALGADHRRVVAQSHRSGGQHARGDRRGAARR